MVPVKRIEIVTGTMEVEGIERILEDLEIRGYVIHNAVVGKGNRWVASPNALTGEFEGRLISTTCDPETADRLLATLDPFLKRYGGACIIYDASVVLYER